MNNKEILSWEKVRAKGKRRYVFTRGILGCGLGFGTLTAISRVLVSKDINSIEEFLLFWIGALIFGGTLGSLFVRAEWDKRERDYWHRNDESAAT